MIACFPTFSVYPDNGCWRRCCKAKPTQIAQFAQRTAKKKIPEIIAALEEHQMSHHHRLMIRFSLEHLRFLEDQIHQLDEEISNKIREAGYEKQWELLQTVPAVGEPNAATILAEGGPILRSLSAKST